MILFTLAIANNKYFLSTCLKNLFFFFYQLELDVSIFQSNRDYLKLLSIYEEETLITIYIYFFNYYIFIYK